MSVSHCNKNPIYVCLFWALRGLSPDFHMLVCLWAIYILYSQDQSTTPHISCSRIGRSIIVIYKSLTDTWVWKLRLWPRNSFSGNICFKFSALVLCSACTNYLHVHMYSTELCLASFKILTPHPPTPLASVSKGGGGGTHSPGGEGVGGQYFEFWPRTICIISLRVHV